MVTKFRMPAIPGKLKAEDLDQLDELVEGKRVLQLGCYCGRGLVALSLHAGRIWVLENFLYPGGMTNVVAELASNVDRHAPEDKVINLLRGDADGWAVPLGSENVPVDGVDVVYRDADRPRREEERDQRLAMAMLTRHGGVYAWHDADHNLRWLQVQPVSVEAN